MVKNKVKLIKGLEENLDETCENQIEAEIARVAHPIMRLQGGIILLEDIYCAVNRARGTQLVSPEEVLLASRQIAQKYPQGKKNSHDKLATK